MGAGLWSILHQPGEKGKDIYKGKYRRGISCECRFNHANTPFTPFWMASSGDLLNKN